MLSKDTFMSVASFLIDVARDLRFQHMPANHTWNPSKTHLGQKGHYETVNLASPEAQKNKKITKIYPNGLPCTKQGCGQWEDSDNRMRGSRDW